MTGEKLDPSRDLGMLANEACDLWQEHLSSYAADPKAKAELMHLLAPSRRLFAEWAAMMQNGSYGTNVFGKNGPAGQAGGATAGTAGGRKPDAASPHHASRAETAGPASDGSALELAQLADRVARLEERLAGLDPGAAREARPHHQTPRPRTKS